MSSLSNTKVKRKVGIVGYGSLGKFLANAIINDARAKEELELVFVWNRTPEKVLEDVKSGKLPESVFLKDLENFKERKAELIVEVAHAVITETMGPKFLETANYMVGSPTCFASQTLEKNIRDQLQANKDNNLPYGVFIPAGALWGANDIQKLADRGTLKGLSVTMKFSADALRLKGALKDKLDQIVSNGDQTEEVLLYDGPIRDLAPMAPNNVNTIACAALAGHTLGFDKTNARLFAAAPDLGAHVVIVNVDGPNGFKVDTTRFNPAKKGAVTGNATYNSFLSSMLAASGKTGMGNSGRMSFL
jgi:aspartate dehydrogenase